MRVTTATSVLTADPGTTTDVVIDVVNTGEVIDGVSARVIGLPDDAVLANPALLPLFPDASGQVTLSLTIPSTQPAGRHPLTVEVVSHGAMLPSQFVDLDLDVGASPAFRLAASPREIRARRRGRFVLELTNTGNIALDVNLHGVEVDRASSLAFKPDSLSLPPGAVAPVLLHVRGPRMLVGGEVDRTITVAATATRPFADASSAAGALPPQTSTVRLRQRPLLSRGLLTAMILGAIVALWATVFLLGLTKVFSGDLLTKSAPTSFFPAAAHAGSGTGANGTPADAAAPPGTLPKTGQVSAGEGASLKGTVTSQSEGEPVGRILVEAVRMSRNGPVTASSAATQTDGTYTLAGLFPGEYLLRFGASGFRTVWYPQSRTRAQAATVTAVAQGSSTGLDVQIAGEPASISGAVDPGDTLSPVVSTVVARPLMSTSAGPVVRARTNGAGAYTLKGLPAPASYELTFTANGYAASTIVDFVNGGDHRLEPTVQLGASSGQISGTVTDGDKPIGGVTVTTSVRGKSVSVLTPTSGQVGTFHLGDLPTPATYVISFTAPGHGAQTKIIDLAAGKSQTNLDTALQPGTGSVSGRVVDDKGNGLGGATVTIDGTAAPVAPTTTTLTTGAVGSFVINRLPTPGTYTATITLAGYAPATIPVTMNANLATPVLKVTLANQMGGVQGTVTGPKGNPYVGAKVTATDGLRLWETQSSGPGTALPAGGYLLPGLSPGSYSVTVRAPGHQQQTALVTVVAGHTTRQPLELGG